MNVKDAEKQFLMLVESVRNEGISVDLELNGIVIARLVPAIPASKLKVRDLNEFIKNLPPLGDDADDFIRDIEEVARKSHGKLTEG
jgi:antitoxin (DNA-binding transcriptional repressor) of toxin-antitoxin stability system